jgi:putative FmdB family regulatory protein
MPLYDYECKACEFQFDELIRMDDRKKPTRKKCPNCGRKKVKQVILGTPATVDPINIGVRTTDSAYKEVIAKINEGNPGAGLDGKGWRASQKVQREGIPDTYKGHKELDREKGW